MEENNDVTNYLDNTFNKNSEPLPALQSKYKKNRLTKIEIAGKMVIEKVMSYAQNTDLSYTQMAKRLNDEFDTNISKSNIIHFLKSNKNYFIEFATQEKQLNELRADLYLEHNGILVKDIKILDQQIEKLSNDELTEIKDKARIIGILLDKKGVLLERHAKLSGKLINDKNFTQIENLQMNVYNQVEKEKSEVIQRLKKAEFVNIVPAKK